MRLVIQRVSSASVSIEGECRGSIGRGYMVLVGIAETDDEKTVDKYLAKLLKLRIFEDQNKKTNLSIRDVGGELLLISQFTLLASCRDGNRPSFTAAGTPQKAKFLYEYMIEKAKESGMHVEKGEFGADMQIALVNEGPFTIVLDEREIK